MRDKCCHQTVITRCTDCPVTSRPLGDYPIEPVRAEVDHATVVYQPWHPMKDPVDIKTLGKALEEAGELISAMARCLIQGIDEKEPQTGKSNRQWLEEELADVDATNTLVKERFGVAPKQQRVEIKKKRLREWHALA